MTITVTQLNNYIHGLFNMDNVLADLSVAGEITNVKASRDGWYFSLKDEAAAIDCFCYASAGQPTVGMLAVVEGKINYWVKSGRISFFVRRLSASQNTGAAYLKFLELKEKLQKEGLFDEIRKKPVPNLCMKIGVVTSATGAVIHDIQNVVHRRQPFTQIVLYPVKVQGVGADEEIAQGIRYFADTDVDAVIVGRGGGSNEDLSMFNAEVVVRAVAECPKPIVSAVGHGVDFTLCDFAADRRAVTPSEAAEFVTTDSLALKNAIVARLMRSSAIISKQLQAGKNATLYSAKCISAQTQQAVERSKNIVLRSLSGSLARLENILNTRRAQTENALSRLSSANPTNILKRGYAYLQDEHGKISSVSQVVEGQNISIKLVDGQLSAKVEKVTK